MKDWLIPATPDWHCNFHCLEAADLNTRGPTDRYGLLWIAELGQGQGSLDFSTLSLAPQQMLCWHPGQALELTLRELSGYRLDFGVDRVCETGLDDRQVEDLGLFGPDRGLLNVPPALAAEIAQLGRWWQALRPETAYREAVNASYLRLLLLRLASLTSPPPASPPETQVLGQRFRHLLNQHYRSWHQVSDYAEALAMTPDHLNARLRELTGQSAKTLIQQRLILEARRAAWFSDASLKEITYSLGFDDPAYFSRLFHRCTGQRFSDFKARIQDSSRA
ncbi:MAG: helix-turn-helix domain-containing protein [Candidatus Sericytochromatia bacterium]